MTGRPWSVAQEVGYNSHATAKAACENCISRAKGPAYRTSLAQNHANLANLLATMGRPRQAVEEYGKALKVKPDESDALSGLAWLLATCPDVLLRDPNRAVELAKKATALAPEEATYWRTLGAAHYRTGAWQAAIAALTKARELAKKEETLGGFFEAMAYWQLGERDRAKQVYDRVREWMAKHKPKDAEWRRFQAEAAGLLGINDAPADKPVPPNE